MLAVQRVVKELIFDPDTPGGFRFSIDCRTLSSSATAADILYAQPAIVRSSDTDKRAGYQKCTRVVWDFVQVRMFPLAAQFL